MKPNIALIGHMGSGKTTIAQELISRHGYNAFSWATPVKEIAGMAYGDPIQKQEKYRVNRNSSGYEEITGREILQALSTDAIRNLLDHDFWIKIGMRRIPFIPTPIVNDDTRFGNEVDTLLRNEWIIIKLMATEDTRRKRLIAKGDYVTGTEGHASEMEIDTLPYHIAAWNTANPRDTADMIMLQLAGLTDRMQQIARAAH